MTPPTPTASRTIRRSHSVMPSGAGTQAAGDAREQAKLEFPPGVLRQRRTQEDVHDVSNFTIPGEFAEGRTYLGTINVTTDANGLASFTANLPALPAGAAVCDRHRHRHHRRRQRAAQQHLCRSPPLRSWAGRASLSRTPMTPGWGALREAIINANLTPGTQTITFAIPATDARHFYYRDDGVAGEVTTADIAVTTATDDATIAGIDPDWPHSWYSIAAR